jgi:serine/threonine protein kinase
LKKDAHVALKVLAAEFPQNDVEMQRFVQVFKTVLPLRHPHLVSYYGIGKTGPFCWLSMELIEHTPVPEIIEKLQGAPKIDWQRPYRVALQIGQALAFAHQHHVVHRNITAGHILWRRADKTSKLADLGLAAGILDSNLSQVVLRHKLQAEMVYLSPEQTQPGCFVDGVCDIYSLGVVVYALLTGRYPCTGATQAETIRNIRETAPVRPTKLQPEVPKRFEAVVMKMLAKRQEDRYQTAEQLLADLQLVGKEQGVPA